MWLLKDPNGKIKYLKPNKTFNVGRKETDIILPNDLSISRAHATITVTLKDKMMTTELSSTCIVKDANSKYGTYVIRNGIQLRVSSEGYEIQPSDTVKFGLQHHTFIVEHIPFITVISRLNTDDKNKLKDIMDSIGGIVTDHYVDNCTHLTATTASSTNKIISALIAGIPIINIDYWMAVVDAIEANSNLPDPNSFTLPLLDKGVNTQRVSLKPNPVRKTLFQGKTFIFFFEKTYKEYKKMIKEAGGKVELHSIINSEKIPEDLLVDNNIIMQITDDCVTDDLAIFNAILYDKMQEMKLRMISETEIPLAIVYVSLDQYCNPKFHFKELMRRKNLKKDTSKILALDTQDILMPTPSNINVAASKKVQIPETDDMMRESISQEENYSTKVDIQKPNPQPLIIKTTDKDCNKEIIEKIDKSKNNDIFIKAGTSKKQDMEIEDNLLDEAESVNGNTNTNSHSLETKEELQMTNEGAKILSTISSENIDSGNSKDSINNEGSVLIAKKAKNVSSGNDNNKGKKRPREKSDVDELNKNEPGSWKSKEKENCIEVHKRRKSSTVVSENNDDFDELEQQKTEIKDKKQNKVDKWGFKKTEKKVINFDLDDLDMDEPKIEIKKDILEDLSDTSQKSAKYSEQANQTKKIFPSKENNEIDGSIQAKSSNASKIRSKENVNWTNSVRSSRAKDVCKNSALITTEINSSSLVRPNVKLEFNTDIKKDNKVFRKVYNEIPIKRIALSDMTVWRQNA